MTEEFPVIDVLKDKADELFRQMKNASSRQSCGGNKTFIVDVYDKKYAINIEGAWEKSDWYELKIVGVDSDFYFEDTIYNF